MKAIHYLHFLLFSITIIFSCCKEKVEGPEDNTATGAGFFYAENNSNTLTKADEAVANKQYNTLIAKKNNQTIIEINLTDFKTGTHSLSSKYAFTYVKDGKHWEATAGSLQITKNDGSKISGTYEATAGTGVTGVSVVKGNFTDIPLK
jgi:hypothetical protein